MPSSKQAKKRVTQNDKRRMANKTVRTAMRSAEKKVLEAEAGDAAQAALVLAVKRVDKAAKKGIVHANNAARKKSRLARVVAAKS
jgi:small subunit ribosomal protein S20